MGKHLVKARNLKNLKAFGNHVKVLRESKKLTQEHLADLAGISENTIAVLESGMLNPTVATCFEIAKALKIHPKTMFDF